MPDAATAAYGIEGKLYLQRFYMSDDAFHHKQQSPKIIKRFMFFMVTTKLYEINTIALKLHQDSLDISLNYLKNVN